MNARTIIDQVRDWRDAIARGDDLGPIMAGMTEVAEDIEDKDIPGRLFKTHIIVWSRYDTDELELEELARAAASGDAYCSKQISVPIEDPKADPDWDGTEFFDSA